MYELYYTDLVNANEFAIQIIKIYIVYMLSGDCVFCSERTEKFRELYNFQYNPRCRSEPK